MTSTIGVIVPDDFYREPPVELKNLAVDLDGTLCNQTWTPEQSKSLVGDPITENIAKLFEAVAAGYTIDIHTARPWVDRDMIEAWLVAHQIPYRAIVCGKILAHRYVDDKAVPADAKKWF